MSYYSLYPALNSVSSLLRTVEASPSLQVLNRVVPELERETSALQNLLASRVAALKRTRETAEAEAEAGKVKSAAEVHASFMEAQAELKKKIGLMCDAIVAKIPKVAFQKAIMGAIKEQIEKGDDFCNFHLDLEGTDYRMRVDNHRVYTLGGADVRAAFIQEFMNYEKYRATVESQLRESAKKLVHELVPFQDLNARRWDSWIAK